MPPPAPPPPPFCCSSISSSPGKTRAEESTNNSGSSKLKYAYTYINIYIYIKYVMNKLPAKYRLVALRTAESSSSCRMAFHPCQPRAYWTAARYEYQNMSTCNGETVTQIKLKVEINYQRTMISWWMTFIGSCKDICCWPQMQGRAHIRTAPNAQVFVFLQHPIISSALIKTDRNRQYDWLMTKELRSLTCWHPSLLRVLW